MEISLAVTGIIALITALVQVFKGLGLPSKFAPLGAVALGVLYFVFSVGVDAVTIQVVVNGIATGLASVGLYSIGGETVLKTLSGGK